ncbi:MAG: HmuY family protein [Bacteroidales bacterium]|jgi:hypothetical protein|nr:HmuY family protein [Bacteroidales bacterium]
MRKISFLIFVLPLLLTSCFKEDERVTPYDRGDKITAMIPMTAIENGNDIRLYKNQVYYKLSDSAIVSSNDKTSWDLAFDATETRCKIWLNTANFMLAGQTETTNLSEVNSAAGLAMQFDPSSGNPDSTVLRNWILISENDTSYSEKVYVIDRGYNEAGTLLGYRKIKFDSLVNDTYYFTYANLNNTEITQASVSKIQGYNRVYFSFETGQQLQPEPAQTAYDLLFTQYTTLLFTNEGDPYPYLVTGVLLNPFATEVAFDSTLLFDELDLVSASNLLYTTQADRIGYNWKDVKGDVESGVVSYVVKPEWNYIIHSQNGELFKMRFVSFYDQQGVKGFPTIEFQRL